MTSALALRPINAQQPISTIEDLRAHLYHAAQLELSTIPLYLYAAYSIQTQSYSQWAPSVSAFRSIRSVVIEEMLHLSLARNLMIAIGGADEIRFYDQEFVPTYPSPMLHRIPTLMLSLEPCSETLMRKVFMPLELPAKTDAPPQPNEYHTIGQFYAAIKQGFETLDGPELWQGNRPALQYASTYWNQDGGGSPIVVCDLQTALDAIKTIVEQGEGIDPHRAVVPLDPVKPQPGLSELSHYAKFRRIAEGIDQIGTVWPVRVNPRAADYPSPARELAELFNAAYSYLLYMLDALFASSRQTIVPGQQSARYGIERTFVGAMNGLVFPIADLLVRQPLGDGTNAAPTFEFYPFDLAQPLPQQLGAMCDALLGQYPSLGGDNGVRAMINMLPHV
jgi:hypothetical protein